MVHTLFNLPLELLESILLQLDPPSLISASYTCRALYRIASNDPEVWRSFCRNYFRLWAPHHHIAAKFAGPLSAVDWRSLYFQRVRTNRETSRLIEAILSSQAHRLAHMSRILGFGLDAKETLLKECACPDDAEDVLARRYYAKAALDMIHRESAIEVWKRLDVGEDIPMERALGAYDVFTSISPDVDFDTVHHDISRLAEDLLKQNPQFQTTSARDQASIIAGFLHTQGFRGVSNASYRALHNSFIGYALRSSSHETLPLISVAIFCALAKCLGLDARPCGFVFHVYCIVYAPKDYTLDGDYKPTSSSELHSMYLDPFRSSEEVSPGDLRRVLREMGVPTSDHATFLSDTTTREMVLRTARNIMNSVQTIRQGQVHANGIASPWPYQVPDIDASFYSSIWSMMLLSPNTPTQLASNTTINNTPHRRQYLPYLLDHMQIHHPWDVSLIERHAIPFFSGQREGLQLESFVSTMRNDDALATCIKPRGGIGAGENVRYYVGQLFYHKRYHYEGVITGWDTSCSQEEEWIEQMQVDKLAGGRSQSFYHVLVGDKSTRYVAEENIQLAPPGTEPTPALMQMAGRHFKRWDAEAVRFVSNIVDEYPDD
ncbi:YccV-like-domain-containing protein [Periconia macrospinosa]|uniref:YccV-like-domain-containing protein n=1 Tax=Periconia macrospinosa TaxID=97972 RepID=A0A2V1EA29_9PLEO|nr:YccV-like-domain-containing protein [Periconia macrospinosa]